MVTDDDDEGADFARGKAKRFDIRILIRHPSIDPDRITKALQLTPNRSTMVGTVRKGPKGHILPGLHGDSTWSHWLRVERNRFFFKDAVKLIDRLEPYKAFLIELQETGGTISLIFHLPGDTNIGDTLKWRDIARLGAMRIDLGVEVFPEFN